MANALQLSKVQTLALQRAESGAGVLQPSKETPIATIRSLQKRGLVQYAFSTGWTITNAGRASLERHERHAHAVGALAAMDEPSPPAPADLAKSLKELVEYFGPPMKEAVCHAGICSMKKCVRCGHLLRAQELLANVPKGWLEGT